MGNVIPAVCKRESSSFAPGCPIKTFGHDGKWMLMAHSAFALHQKRVLLLYYHSLEKAAD
jgi:hypothetical protein